MPSITTTQQTTRQPLAPAAVSSSPLFFRIHLALTMLLLAGFVVLGLLAVAGLLRFGKAPSRAVAAKTEDPEPTKQDVEGGRYQIESVDDVSGLLNETGKLDGILESGVLKAFVFRYKGGPFQCLLETEYNGVKASPGAVPRDKEWPNLIGGETGVREDDLDSFQKEGYVVLLNMVRLIPPGEALRPFMPHVAATFTTGPAGPLHSLLPFHCNVNVERLREFRIFLTASPPKGKKGSGYTVWRKNLQPVWTPYNDDAPLDEMPSMASGKNLVPENEMILFECQQGLSTVRLRGRFLSDHEALAKAQKDK